MRSLFFKKSGLFFTFLSTSTIIFLFLSYNFLTNRDLKLENETNNKNITILLKLLNDKFKSFEEITVGNYSEMKNISLNLFDHVQIHESEIINSKNIIEESSYFKEYKFIKVYVKKAPDYLTNYYFFYDKNQKFKFLLETRSYRNFINDGKETIFMFSTALIFYLILVFFLTYFYEKGLEKANETLEEKVEKRTKQINSTLKELEKVNLKLYDLAHTDHLTQIKNRRSFFLHGEVLYDDAKSKNDKISVIMIDIDNFKNINDTYGHNFGDKVLRAFTNSISLLISETSVFGRIGGEEFAIIIPNADVNVATEKAEYIRERIQNMNIKFNKQPVNVTASFGVSDNFDTIDIDEMIRNADKMLYAAKESGKNKVRSNRAS